MGCRARFTPLLVLLALTAPSCSFSRSGETREPDAPAARSVGDGVALPGDAPAPLAGAATDDEVAPTPAEPLGSPQPGDAPRATTGFAISVAGPDGRPRPGVPASVTGGTERTIVSDSDGLLRLATSPGRFEIRIDPGCTDTVQVETGAVGRIAVPEGEVVRGDLTVSARRRHFPGGPVTYRAQRPTAATEESGRQWKLGVAYVVRFTMIDRCTGSPAAGASVEGLHFGAGRALEVRLQEATTADAEGEAVAAAICRAEGEELELVASDRAVPDDRVDLFSRALLDDTAPSCVR